MNFLKYKRLIRSVVEASLAKWLIEEWRFG